jgi:hypothetical protein
LKKLEHPAIQAKIVQNFGGFIHQIKVRHPMGSKDSIKPCAEEAGGGRLVFSSAEL